MDKEFFLHGLCAFLALAPFAAAQSPAVCPTTGQPSAFCINQPHAGDTEVTGAFPGGANPNISIKINGIAATGNLSTNVAQGVFSQSVEALNTYDQVRVENGAASIEIGVQPATGAASPAGSSLFTLGLIGIDATSSGSSGPTEQYFVEFDVLTPVGWCNRNRTADRRYSLQHKCWIWFSPRLASAPTANTSALSSLSSSSFSSGASGESVAGITQTFDFQGGFEYSPLAPWNGAEAGWQNNWSRSSISLIAGGGLVTPFNAATSSEYSLSPALAAQFQANPSLAVQFPQLAAALCNNLNSYFTGISSYACPASQSRATTVAFVFPNRSRLYRDYYAGFRLRTFYLTGDCKNPPEESPGCKVQNTYPGTLDVRFGQDETVTAGHLTGFVMTIAGSYPLPGSKGSVRVFGSFFTRLAGNRSMPSLALAPVASTVAITDPSVVVQQVSPIDQDYFRLGLGVDLVPLISKWIGNK